eukprot:TRINITY_DN12334_c0_g1_i1.p1 TRINITY_DN12334_c0_g1~~TRINITY_DN12334_c0_g1_i1.p1  ORF type:complete len:181 (-),score=22.99 TRINITY_DN12334_c0_g1_i1:350-862(-)
MWRRMDYSMALMKGKYIFFFTSIFLGLAESADTSVAFFQLGALRDVEVRTPTGLFLFRTLARILNRLAIVLKLLVFACELFLSLLVLIRAYLLTFSPIKVMLLALLPKYSLLGIIFSLRFTGLLLFVLCVGDTLDCFGSFTCGLSFFMFTPKDEHAWFISPNFFNEHFDP